MTAQDKRELLDTIIKLEREVIKLEANSMTSLKKIAMKKIQRLRSRLYGQR